MNDNNYSKIDSDNLKNYLQNSNPLAIFSQSIIQNDFLSSCNKKMAINSIECNNYNHFSPNLSAGSLKAMSPFYNSINPTPNVIGNGGLSNYFLFNSNYPAATPLKGANNSLSNNVHNINFNISAMNNIKISNNINGNNNNINCNNLINDDNLKSKEELEDVSNNNLETNTNLKINHQSTDSRLINIPKIYFKDNKSLLGIPTPGRNLGFYSWVIHGSPVLHNNPHNNNFITNKKEFIKKRKNLRKKNNQN